MTPTLSAVRAYDPRHLLTLAQTYVQVGNVLEDTTQAAYTAVAAAPWQGEGHTAATDTHRADYRAVTTHADTLRSVADIAQRGYHELTQDKAALLAQVDQLTTQGYQVSEVWTVTPPPRTPVFALPSALATAAQATAALQEGAGGLWAHDAAVSAQISAPTASLADFRFPGHVQLVDSVTDLGAIAPTDTSADTPGSAPPPVGAPDIAGMVLPPTVSNRAPGPDEQNPTPQDLRLATLAQRQEYQRWVDSLPTGCSQNDVLARMGAVLGASEGTAISALTGNWWGVPLAGLGLAQAVNGLSDCDVGPVVRP